MAAHGQSSEERTESGEVRGKPGAMNVVSETAGYGDEPPRMIVALHDSPKDASDDTVFADNEGFERRADAIDAEKLREVLAAVRRGLDQDLKELWETQASQVLMWSEPGSLDEAWAQRFSERFFGIDYGGPGQTYSGDGGWDPYIFSRAQPRMRSITTYAHWAQKKGKWVKQYKGHLRVGASWKAPEDLAATELPAGTRAPGVFGDFEENPDPAIPIVGACQHTVSYGAVTRGLLVEDHLCS